MLAFCSLMWCRKLENPEKTTDLACAPTTLSHAETGNLTRVVAVISMGHNTALENINRNIRAPIKSISSITLQVYVVMPYFRSQIRFQPFRSTLEYHMLTFTVFMGFD